MFCEWITILFAVENDKHDCYLCYAQISTLAMWFTLAVLVLLLVADAVFILLVHFDVEVEARFSNEVNSRRTFLRHLSVFYLDELQ